MRGGRGANGEEMTGDIRSEGTFSRELYSFLATSGAEVCLPFLALALLSELAAGA